MTKPPDDLMQWPKAALAKEVARLRAVLHEVADREHDDARSGGDVASLSDDPYAWGAHVLDTREAVLMDATEVILVDNKRDELAGVALTIEGRVNLTDRRVKQMYLFGTDGAAALVTELTGLAARAGGAFAAEFKAIIARRLEELP